MILYSTKTLADVYEDCALKLGSTRNVENFDPRSFADFVASAMIDVVNFALQYNRWELVSQMVVDDLDAIPTTFLRQQRLLLGTDPELGTPPYIEARYTDIREFFNLSIPKNIMNSATLENPIYCFWGWTQTQHDMIIRIAPNTMSGILEYYDMPVFPKVLSDVIQIPYEYETLLEDYTLSSLLFRMKDFTKLKDVHGSISARKDELIKEYQKYNETRYKELDTFVTDTPNQVNFKTVKRRK
jgi:hypothetical protein